MSTSQMSKSDPDSDGAVSALDDESACPSSQLTAPVADGTSEEGWKLPVFDAPLSPAKALRAAMLKQRFADTILKAQHKTLLDHGDKADPVKMQQEKERLERRQREEKARIEAQIRAAEAASRMKKEIEVKKQREKEREAARVALQKVNSGNSARNAKIVTHPMAFNDPESNLRLLFAFDQMEKTVDLEQNVDVLKELEMLSGCPLSYQPNFYRNVPETEGECEALFGSPLARLGLFIKDDVEDEEILNVDGEEGEILI
uniref:Bromodomain-containing protein n=1 Tax=Rhizophora mucronata TaxID=61149 RepID=A0A2P2M815_RHIMU